MILMILWHHLFFWWSRIFSSFLFIGFSNYYVFLVVLLHVASHPQSGLFNWLRGTGSQNVVPILKRNDSVDLLTCIYQNLMTRKAISIHYKFTWRLCINGCYGKLTKSAAWLILQRCICLLVFYSWNRWWRLHISNSFNVYIKSTKKRQDNKLLCYTSRNTTCWDFWCTMETLRPKQCGTNDPITSINMYHIGLNWALPPLWKF